MNNHIPFVSRFGLPGHTTSSDADIRSALIELGYKDYTFSFTF